jgi:hypothetical protein
MHSDLVRLQAEQRGEVLSHLTFFSRHLRQAGTSTLGSSILCEFKDFALFKYRSQTSTQRYISGGCEEWMDSNPKSFLGSLPMDSGAITASD